MLNNKKDTRVRIKTMTVIENLPVTNAEFSECFILSSLTGSSGKENNGRRKGS